MSNQGSITKVAILLLVVGLAVGGGGGYLISSNLFQSQIGDYEATISNLSSEVSSLTSTISDLETEKSKHESEIVNLEDQVSNLETQISDLETRVSNFETQTSELENQVSDLRSELDEAYDAIGYYEDQVAYLESQVSAIQSVLLSYVPDVFRIGVTATSVESLDDVQTVAAIAKEDINDYCQKEELPFTFDFVVVNNYGEAGEAVESTIMFNDLGINLIVGHETSQETSLSLSYVDSHDMLMISPSATAQEFAVAEDNLFRVCPTYLAHAVVMAESLASWGIRAVVVVQRGDEWADGVYDAFEGEFEARGGVVFKRIRYDPETTNFGGHLNQAEAAALEAIDDYGENHVAIELISLNEASKIIDFAKHYQTIYSLYWFCSESTARSANLFKNLPAEADKLKLFSPFVAQEENEEYQRFAEDYYSIMGEDPDFYGSAMYDACWLYALTIIKTWTAETSHVKQALPGIAEDYYGASGWCRFDGNGDRYAVDYDVWGYGLDDGQVVDVKYGYYDATDGQVTWFEDAGISPPG